MKRFTLSAAILAVIHSTSALATELDEVVVTANNTPQSIKNVIGSVAVITQEEIEDKQYQTLQQALQSVPGINFYNNGGALQSTSIQMRGSSTGQVLIMVDGVSINDPSGFGANLNSLALQNVARIEVIKGPQAGVWGANAAAGVINIISKNAQQSETAQVNFERGSNNTQKIATTLGAGDENADFVFSILDTRSDGYSAIKSKNESVNTPENDAYYQTEINFKMGLNLNKHHRLEASINKNTTNTDYDGYSYGVGYNAEDAISNSEMESELRRFQYNYKQDNFDAKLFISDYQIDRTSTEAFVTGVYNGENNQQGGVVNFEYLPKQKLTAGATFSETKGKSDYYSVSQAKYKSTGTFISNTNQFNQGLLILNQSLRNDQYDNDFEDKTTGKIGIKNFFNNNFYLSAQYGTAYNEPSLYSYTHSVTNLQPESTEGYEFILGFHGLEVSYYKNDVKDLISYNNNNKAFNQTGTSELKGLEISYSNYFDLLDTDLTVSYEQLSAKNADNEWLGRRPESRANLNLSYDGFNKTTLGLQTRYIGEMYDKNNQGGAQIGDFLNTDITANYAINPNFSIYARVINLFDQDGVTSIANYESGSTTAIKDVYSNGGVQFFAGVRGQI